MKTKAKQKLRGWFQSQIWARHYTYPHPLSTHDYGLYWLLGLELRMMNKEEG